MLEPEQPHYLSDGKKAPTLPYWLSIALLVLGLIVFAVAASKVLFVAEFFRSLRR